MICFFKPKLCLFYFLIIIILFVVINFYWYIIKRRCVGVTKLTFSTSKSRPGQTLYKELKLNSLRLQLLRINIFIHHKFRWVIRVSIKKLFVFNGRTTFECKRHRLKEEVLCVSPESFVHNFLILSGLTGRSVS